MEELDLLGALVTSVLSIRWRTDVLTGPYISNRDNDLTIPDKTTDRLNRATVEKRRKMRAFREG
jgi:hypothetical protein